jgi:hypothetical protein
MRGGRSAWIKNSMGFGKDITYSRKVAIIEWNLTEVDEGNSVSISTQLEDAPMDLDVAPVRCRAVQEY